jgi:hypothetical protein
MISTIIVYYACVMAGIQEKEAETSTGLEGLQGKVARQLRRSKSSMGSGSTFAGDDDSGRDQEDPKER